MHIYAIADLHLPFGCPEKDMTLFGPAWDHYTDKIETNWKKEITEEDFVLLGGDLSWASKLDQSLPDFDWIHKLPGQKIIIRGNHDYWWSTKSKMQAKLPSSIYPISKDAFNYKNFSVAGTRLWDSENYHFDPIIIFQKNAPRPKKQALEKQREIYSKEVERLKLSLSKMDKNTETKIVLTHYPTISYDLSTSDFFQLFEEYRIDFSIFGHLHSVKKDIPLFGTKNHTTYLLTSCDYLNFKPIKII